MRYLKIFDTVDDYNSAKSNGLLLPNTSLIKKDYSVYYNEWVDTRIEEYFTIESLEEENEIRFYNEYNSYTIRINYSLDNGVTWNDILSGNNNNTNLIATINTGDRILFKKYGNNYFSNSSFYYNKFKASKKFNVRGNILSLISDNFKNLTEINTNFMFTYIFSGNTTLIDAGDLILPATSLSENCYNNMFSGCTSLKTAPELLPATTLANNCCAFMFTGCTSLKKAPVLVAETLAGGCYNNMFSGCTSLNYIKMLATDISASNCLSSWVKNVASTGTFVKNSAATWNVTGSSGIPSGWTVETEEII